LEVCPIALRFALAGITLPVHNKVRFEVQAA
jgi:hypothetical protein